MPALKRALCLFGVLGFFILFALLRPSNIFSYFSDDFSGFSINREVWQIYNNSGSISVNDGKLSLVRSSTKSNSFPYIYAKTNIFPESGPFSIRIKYRYLSTGNFGDGITISTGSVPANGVNPGSNIPSYITFSSWQTAPLGLYHQKVLCNPDGSKCNQIEFLNAFSNVPDFDDHEFRIDYLENGQYIIYLEGSEIPKYTSALNQKRPNNIWIGNSIATSTVDFWSSFEIDYIHVDEIIENTPMVLIPGFGGSWDEAAILTGTEGNNWKIPDYVKVYDGLKQSTIDAGYEEGKDLFVFAYDWRKPLDQLADDLKSFLEEKNLDEKKSNFIGHSMGGLVARAYAQKYGLEKVNKIITAGSPHEGTLEAYNIWEGASVWGDVWWEKVLLETQAQLHRKPGETKIDAIRRIAPSVKDLLPTTDYIAKNGELQPWDSLKQKNQYLKNLNGASAVVNEILLPLWSSDEQTRAVVNAEKPSTYEKLFGLWEDGKPAYADPYEFQPGDGTVIKNSAKGPFTTEIPGNGSHANLVAHDQNIRKIFESLGLATDDIVGGSTTSEQNALVAVLQSPGTITVCNADESSCNLSGGVSLADGKLYFLPGYDGSKVVVKVIANETGKYKLHLGNITSNGQWETVTGDLKNIGQTDKFTVEGGSVNVVGDDLTSARYLLEAKKKLNEYSPKWDTKGNIELLADQTAAMNRRILSATTLRVSLRDEYKKAKRTTNYEYFENAIDMWNAIDQVMETILASSPLPNSLNGAGVNKQLSEPKQKLSYFGSALAALALDRSSESKEVSNSKMWVKLDKQIQADILMGYALQIK